MKLFTNPRPACPMHVRRGDQIALYAEGPTGRRFAIDLEARFVDLDLAERVEWGSVHASHMTEDTHPPRWTIVHTGGVEDDLAPDQTVIIREVIELDPWSYVKRSGATN